MKKKIHNEQLKLAGGDMLSQKTNEDFNKQKPDPNSPNFKAAPLTYTCPMHPKVGMNKPGKCPKCGMRLMKKSSRTISN
ncbi:MAG TPA: heavy metal-binding domain-containing protein [Cyclobacteriaceae bacterium]|jgi:hypothetical protein|nr:heavy metal-binding domain-containing protein [Cyclobacteriaceae bacterium]